MKPKYPHIADDKIPKALTVVQNPDASMITEIPPLGTLMGAVADYLKEAGAESANSEIKLTDPGVVMVLKKGMMGKPFGELGGRRGHERRPSIMPNFPAKNDAWVEANKRYGWEPRCPRKSRRRTRISSMDKTVRSLAAQPHLTTAATPTDNGTKVMKRDSDQRPCRKRGMIVHEYLHTFDHWDPSDIGWGMDEGFVEFFARDLTARHDYQ